MNDVYTIDCVCLGTYIDTDNDGVCDNNDICPNFDDNIDIDNDNIPDNCDDCFDFLLLNNNNSIDFNNYSVEQYITSETIIPVGDSIIYSAKDSINLIAGFEVQQNSAFESKIGGCINQ